MDLWLKFTKTIFIDLLWIKMYQTAGNNSKVRFWFEILRKKLFLFLNLAFIKTIECLKNKHLIIYIDQRGTHGRAPYVRDVRKKQNKVSRMQIINWRFVFNLTIVLDWRRYRSSIEESWLCTIGEELCQ